MTLLYFDGFESGEATSRPEWGQVTTSFNAVTPRTGSYSLASGIAAGNPLTLPGGPVAQLIIGFAWRMSSGGFGLVSIYGDTNTTQHLTVMHNAAGNIELRRGGTAGTLLGTSAASFPFAQYRHLQVKATIHDTTGICQVRVDGVTVIDYSGDTKSGGTADTIDTVRLLLSSGSSLLLDDLWICNGVDATATQGRPNNDWMGDLKVSGLLPSAAGDSTQMTPSTGTNWSCVDDSLITGVGDFVTSTAAAQRDLYQLVDLLPAAVSVFGVRVASYGQKTDAGLYGVKHLLKENGVVTADSTPRPLSTNFAGATGGTYYKRPSDDAMWTVSDVNALQAGIEAVQM